MVRLILLISWFMTLPAAETLPEADSSATIDGKAYHLKTGKFAYTEVREKKYRQGRLIVEDVDFSSPDGQRLAHKRVDYSRSRWQPDVVMEQFVPANQIRITVSAGRLQVTEKKGEGKLAKAEIEIPAEARYDGGIGQMLKDFFPRLDSGFTLVFPLMVAQRRAWYEFQIRKTVNPRPGVAVFEMTPVNWMIKLLVDPILMTYDTGNGRVLEYQGVTDLLDTGGDNHKVRIEYSGRE